MMRSGNRDSCFMFLRPKTNIMLLNLKLNFHLTNSNVTEFGFVREIKKYDQI